MNYIIKEGGQQSEAVQIGHTLTLSIDILYYAITKLCWAYQKEAWFLQSQSHPIFWYTLLSLRGMCLCC